MEATARAMPTRDISGAYGWLGEPAGRADGAASPGPQSPDAGPIMLPLREKMQGGHGDPAGAGAVSGRCAR